MNRRKGTNVRKSKIREKWLYQVLNKYPDKIITYTSHPARISKSWKSITCWWCWWKWLLKSYRLSLYIYVRSHCVNRGCVYLWTRHSGLTDKSWKPWEDKNKTPKSFPRRIPISGRVSPGLIRMPLGQSSQAKLSWTTRRGHPGEEEANQINRL